MPPPSPPAPDRPVIRVVAAVVRDDAGRFLVVRKRGTRRFMQAGGKPDPGEGAVAALVRELREELTLVVTPEQVRALRTCRDVAANEPGHDVVAEVFAVDGVGAATVRAGAEIEDLAWVWPDTDLPLAPLTARLLSDREAAFAPRHPAGGAVPGLPRDEAS